MKILAVETSCDETSIAIIDNAKILSNVVFSQIDSHKKYGGVVPELASRLHFENFGYVLEQALNDAKLNIEDIEQIAYTEKPGLIGCLHIGKMIAKTLSSYLNAPLIPCDHLEGHIYSVAIKNDFIFPALFLIASGGHTQLVLLKKHLDFHVLGSTLDDAVGEAYDKVGRLLGYSYPAGPIIDNNSKKGQDSFELPVLKKNKNLNFSFSGLKSFCANLIDKNKNNKNFNKIDFCTSFQNTIIKILFTKIDLAVNKYKPKMISIVGGVSANSLIRKTLQEYGKKQNINIFLPDLIYCTDNAAMIARLAYQKYLEQK